MVTPASHSIGVGRPIKLEGGKESGWHTKPSEGRTIWYLGEGGGGLEKNEKKNCWKCGQKKKFVVEIDEKIC